MDDLLHLNRAIVKYWLGKLDASQEQYLNLTPVCLGQLPHSAEDLAHTLAAAKRAHDGTLRALALNRLYLSFARLAGKDVVAGKLDMLVKLGINMDQAHLLSRLTNDEIALLALVWQGPIIKVPLRSFVLGASMQLGAIKHHATACISAHSD